MIHCAPERHAIRDAVARALALDCGAVVNPYGDGCAAPRIISVLRELPIAGEDLKKPFHLLEESRG